MISPETKVLLDRFARVESFAKHRAILIRFVQYIEVQ
jgi:hypothetical protein